jgi:glucokinase
MDRNGAIAARGESAASDANDAIRVAALEALAGANGARPAAVGLSFPDPDSRNWASNLTFLAVGTFENVPVRTLSTGNASALAESWYGSGKGVRNLIAFSIGPCASAGVIANGALLLGAHGLASSVQWLALNPVEREDYRRMGCLEAEGGAAGIVRRLVWRVKSGDCSRVVDAAGGDFNAVTLDMILKGARDNDGVAISVIRDTVKYLAMAISNIAAIVDPELIVLGGILESSGDLLLDPIRQECARRMPPGIFDNVRIEVSQLGADCAPMGAARFAESGSQLP